MQVTDSTPRVSVGSLVYVPSAGLSAGAIAGIVLIVLAAAGLLAVGGFWLVRRRGALRGRLRAVRGLGAAGRPVQDCCVLPRRVRCMPPSTVLADRGVRFEVSS